MSRSASLLLAALLACVCPLPSLAAGLDDDAPPPTVTLADAPSPAPSDNGVAPRGNPLWSMSLDSLTATRARPLFTPSRRPPVTEEAAPAPAAPPPPPAKPSLQLTLLGTVVGRQEAYGIFLDPSRPTPLNLRAGATHNGWMLTAVAEREATLRNGAEAVVLKMPYREPPPPASPGPRPPEPTRPGAGPTRVGTLVPATVRVPRHPAPSPLDAYPDH